MFKIIENDDGSTTVYCNDTGRILCSVPRKRDKPLAEIQPNSVVEETSQKIMSTLLSKKKRPKGIGRPIPREVEPPEPKPIVSNGHHPSNGYSPLQCNIRPLPWPSNGAGVVLEKCEFNSQDDSVSEQDINEDCISQPEFLQIFNLCSQELAGNGEWKRLRERLPTRMISRPLQNHFVSTSDRVSEYDITTPISLRWLRETPEGRKKTLNENGVSMSIKKYETFCKFAIGSSYLSGNVSPYSMRCREQKDNVTFKPMKAQIATHQYCFTRQQRAERRIAVETGLNKRSRDLQEKVLKNNLSIRMKRLADEEIEKWTSRRASSTFPIVEIDCELDISAKTNPGLKNGLKPGFSARKSLMPNSFGRLNPFVHSCEVKLRDILKKLDFKGNTVYVHGTSTTVRLSPAMFKYFRYRNMKHHSGDNSPRQTRCYDHPGMMPHTCKTTGGAIKTAVSQNKRSCDTSKTSGSLNKKLKAYSSVSQLPTPTGIQLIDIVSDDDDTIVPMTQSQLLSNVPTRFTVVFKCFGCNFKNKFRDKKVATSSVKEHMMTYHAVMEPKAFLNVHINKQSKILLIEAFPGYKERDSD